MDEKAVIELGQRVYRVDISRQIKGGLRLAHGDNALGLAPAEEGTRLIPSQESRNVGEHVE